MRWETGKAFLRTCAFSVVKVAAPGYLRKCSGVVSKISSWIEGSSIVGSLCLAGSY